MLQPRFAAGPGGTFEGILFLAVGVFALLAAPLQWRRERRLRRIGERTQGFVMRLSWSGGKAHPVFVFQTPDGRRIEVRSQFGTSPPMFSAGDAVGVLYDPARPERARIDRAAFGTGAIVVSFFVGAVFALIGLAILRYV